jgi:hypothetical protein
MSLNKLIQYAAAKMPRMAPPSTTSAWGPSVAEPKQCITNRSLFAP